MKVVRHILIVAGALFLILGIPVWKSGWLARAVSGVDAVSSATTILEQPSGNYMIYLNEARHPDAETRAAWVDFFNGEEIGILFEDLQCVVAEGDAAGIAMAESFQSRLPENQMTIRQEEATLMLSKAEHGRYDVMVLSQEMAEALAAGTLETGAENIAIRVQEE